MARAIAANAVVRKRQGAYELKLLLAHDDHAPFAYAASGRVVYFTIAS